MAGSEQGEQAHILMISKFYKQGGLSYAGC